MRARSTVQVSLSYPLTCKAYMRNEVEREQRIIWDVEGVTVSFQRIYFFIILFLHIDIRASAVIISPSWTNCQHVRSLGISEALHDLPLLFYIFAFQLEQM